MSFRDSISGTFPCWEKRELSSVLARFHRTQVCIRSRGRRCTGGSFTSQAGLPGIIEEFFTVSSGIVTNRSSALSFDILCLILRETLDVSRHDPNVGNRTSRSRSPHDETAPTVQAITPCWEPRTPAKQEQSSSNVV